MKIFILALILNFSLILCGTILEVDINGTTPYSEIQNAIDSAIPGDTVLVYPGRYFENVRIEQYNLTLASLYILNNERTYIDQTIIDGNQLSSAVFIEEVNGISIIGFSITNGVGKNNQGRGTFGGGIFARYSEAEISFNKIYNNKASCGGGIMTGGSDVVLTGNSIHHNYSSMIGGGLYTFVGENEIYFSNEYMNSIYMNYSGEGSDISFEPTSISIDVVVDTFTVEEPDCFYFNDLNNHSLSINNGYITPIEQDLYVSPEGSDSNTGLTPEDPLQTIARAQILIKSDADNQHTIHLAQGEYSPSLNNQKLCISVKNFVPLVGDSPETTIINAEYGTPLFYNKNTSNSKYLTIRDLSLTNYIGTYFIGSGIYLKRVNEVNFDNVHIYGGMIENGNLLRGTSGIFNLNNVEFRDNEGKDVIKFLPDECDEFSLTLKITNSVFCNNRPVELAHGSIILINSNSQNNNFEMINCQITDNDMTIGLAFIDILSVQNVNIINCTIGNNILTNQFGSAVRIINSIANLYNNIIYNETPYWLRLFQSGDECEVNINNNLLQYDNDGIYIEYGDPIVNWNDGNIFALPLWDTNNDDSPYSLLPDSPCIDSGSMVLPAGIDLPFYDLAGNERVMGYGIDIGCFESDFTDAEEDEVTEISGYALTNYPNPFNPETIISFSLNTEITENTEIEIYNIKGQKVKSIFVSFDSAQDDKQSVTWNGTDNHNNPVSNGVYFAVLKSGDDRVLATRKMMLIK